MFFSIATYEQSDNYHLHQPSHFTLKQTGIRQKKIKSVENFLVPVCTAINSVQTSSHHLGNKRTEVNKESFYVFLQQSLTMKQE